jgi:hypothetical protein
MVRRWLKDAMTAAALIVAALAVMPAAARADGDPASDVLLSQSLFLPADAGVPAGQAAQLASVLQAAGRSGYGIRVALISGPADLGSVTALWRQPQTYSHFLDEELAPSYRGRVLVVMPNGFGLYSADPVRPAERAAVAALRGPGSRVALAAAGIDAVRRLAAAAGHTLPAAPADAVGSTVGGSGDLVAWIVFALGGIVVVAVWTWSLRTRPLQVRRRRPAP